MKILVACEESQRVCTAFREKGHEAYSCDIIDCSGGHPEWHIKQNVISLLNGNCEFKTCDGELHTVSDRWDMIIAFPPCTFLCVTGNRWFDINRYGEKANQRYKDRYSAIVFFMRFALADCDRIAIENPVGIMSSCYRKPNQIIQPYEHGDPYTKKTCLWLKGLPLLTETNLLSRPATGWNNQSFDVNGKYGGFKNFDENGKITAWNNPETAKIRSKTFPGIAKAMAEQWGIEEA